MKQLVNVWRRKEAKSITFPLTETAMPQLKWSMTVLEGL
jgi:hypothetical protein